MFRHRQLALFLTLLLSVTLLAAGCGGNNGGGGNGPVDPTDYGSLGGSVDIDGSSTVFPISEAMAEEFAIAGADTRVNVAFSGTGGGFEKFCRGEIQISDASRPIQEDEIAACESNGIPEDDIVEVQVAIDALTVVIHPGNDWATCMTVEQLHEAFRSSGATTWADLDPSWPDEEIAFYYPGVDSGTFDYFNEAIIEIDEEANHRGDGTASEDDNVLAIGVEGDVNAIGYFGFAYFQGAGQGLQAVAVDGGDGCVEPSFESALDGSYQPLSRPIFIYTLHSLLEERTELVGFIHFYLSNIDAIVPEVGYVTMPDDLLDQEMAVIEEYIP